MQFMCIISKSCKVDGFSNDLIFAFIWLICPRYCPDEDMSTGIIIAISSNLERNKNKIVSIVPRWRYLLGYRPRHLIFHTLYSRLHRRYYNCSVTNGSLTSCVDYRLLAVGLQFNCWLLSSPAGSLTRLQNCKLKNSRLKNWPCWCRGPA
jgi:hypothetical protein